MGDVFSEHMGSGKTEHHEPMILVGASGMELSSGSIGPWISVGGVRAPRVARPRFQPLILVNLETSCLQVGDRLWASQGFPRTGGGGRAELHLPERGLGLGHSPPLHPSGALVQEHSGDCLPTSWKGKLAPSKSLVSALPSKDCFIILPHGPRDFKNITREQTVQNVFYLPVFYRSKMSIIANHDLTQCDITGIAH